MLLKESRIPYNAYCTIYGDNTSYFLTYDFLLFHTTPENYLTSATKQNLNGINEYHSVCDK